MGNCKMGIEIPVFLVFFSMMLSAPVTMNFIIYRTCYVIMDKDEAACAKLGLNTTDNATIALENEVEPVANYINITISLITQIIPCILCMFIGPWSDKIGRRPILIVTLTGYVFGFAIKTIISAIPSLSPWALFLESIPVILTGGMSTFITISFVYLVDVTKAENRGIRMGIMEGAIGLGMLFGQLISAYLFEMLGYVGVFSICTLLVLLALLTTFIFLDETIVPSADQECRNLFSLVHIKEMAHATFKKRVGYNRLFVLICIGSMILFVMSENNGGTEILLLRSKFHWNLQQLTLFSSIRSVIAMSGGFFGIIILHKVLGITECPLIVVGFLSRAVSTFMIAVAQYDWQIYTAGAMSPMVGVICPLIRSLLSMIVPHDEMGKVFAFNISMESLISVVSGPIYTVVYTNTMDVFPGAFDLIPFFLHIINLLFFIFIMILKARSNTIVYLNINEDT